MFTDMHNGYLTLVPYAVGAHLHRWGNSELECVHALPPAINPGHVFIAVCS